MPTTTIFYKNDKTFLNEAYSSKRYMRMLKHQQPIIVKCICNLDHKKDGFLNRTAFLIASQIQKWAYDQIKTGLPTMCLFDS